MGLLGAVGLAGPQAAAKVTADMSVLNLKNVGLLGALVEGTNTSDADPFGRPVADNDYRIKWATDKLAKMALKSVMDKKRQAHEWDIHRLDADTHALRSMSLVNKMKRSQRLQFELEEAREKIRLERIIMGFDD